MLFARQLPDFKYFMSVKATKHVKSETQPVVCFTTSRIAVPTSVLAKILGYIHSQDYAATQPTCKGFRTVTIASWVDENGRKVDSELFHRLVNSGKTEWTSRVRRLEVSFMRRDLEARQFFSARSILFSGVTQLQVDLPSRRTEETFCGVLKHCRQTKSLVLPTFHQPMLNSFTKNLSLAKRLASLDIISCSVSPHQILTCVQTLQKTRSSLKLNIQEISVHSNMDMDALCQLPVINSVILQMGQLSLVSLEKLAHHGPTRITLLEGNDPITSEQMNVITQIHTMRTLKICFPSGKVPKIEVCPQLETVILETKEFEHRAKRLDEVLRLVKHLPLLQTLDVTDCLLDTDKLKDALSKTRPTLKLLT
jgi:hypothetical protein